MRESKFRGKRLDNGEWEHGDLVQFGQKCYTPCKCAIIPGTASGSDPLCKILLDYEVDHATVGQYTGLKDRNAREIYEGDILAFPANRKEDGFDLSGWRKLFPDYVRLYVIAHNVVNCGFGACLLRESAQDNPDICGLAGADRTYIIGNIHDNPELLKTE